MARPREFDTNEVLTKTMHLFWANGYHSTSLENLMAATHLNKQSLYSAFGDKRALFIKGLQLYTDLMLKELETKVLNKESPLKALSKAVMELAKLDKNDFPTGCMIVRTASELGSSDKEILNLVEKFREQSIEIISTAIRQAQDCDEVTSDISAANLSKHLMTMVIGIQVLKQGSASEKDLRIICMTALNLLKNNQTRRTK